MWLLAAGGIETWRRGGLERCQFGTVRASKSELRNTKAHPMALWGGFGRVEAGLDLIYVSVAPD